MVFTPQAYRKRVSKTSEHKKREQLDLSKESSSAAYISRGEPPMPQCYLEDKALRGLEIKNSGLEPPSRILVAQPLALGDVFQAVLPLAVVPPRIFALQHPP